MTPIDPVRLEVIKNAAANARLLTAGLFVLCLFKLPLGCLALIVAMFAAVLLDLLPGLHSRVKLALFGVAYGVPLGVFSALVFIFVR